MGGFRRRMRLKMGVWPALGCAATNRPILPGAPLRTLQQAPQRGSAAPDNHHQQRDAQPSPKLPPPPELKPELPPDQELPPDRVPLSPEPPPQLGVFRPIPRQKFTTPRLSTPMSRPTARPATNSVGLQWLQPISATRSPLPPSAPAVFAATRCHAVCKAYRQQFGDDTAILSAQTRHRR